MNKSNFDYVKHWQGCPSVVDVARAYFPTYTRSDKAVNHFRQTIAENSDMLHKLTEAGYDPQGKFLTPAQVDIIIRYWNLPGYINHWTDN